MSDDVLRAMAKAMADRDHRKWGTQEDLTDQWMIFARAAVKAIEDAGWCVVPVRENANFITGRAPLDIADIESVGEGALYVDGLTLDEAGALIKKAMAARPRITGETT